MIVNHICLDEDIPTINVISPTDKTYTKDSITFKIESDADEVKFRLDGGSKISMDEDGNFFVYTKTLSNGEHTVIFYAINEHGQTTETVNFNVKISEVCDDCASGYTVIDYPSTITQIISRGSDDNTVIADGTNANKNNSSLILFYLLLGVLVLGILITTLLLIKKMANRK